MIIKSRFVCVWVLFLFCFCFCLFVCLFLPKYRSNKCELTWKSSMFKISYVSCVDGWEWWASLVDFTGTMNLLVCKRNCLSNEIFTNNKISYFARLFFLKTLIKKKNGNWNVHVVRWARRGYSTLSWVRMCGPQFWTPPYN